MRQKRRVVNSVIFDDFANWRISQIRPMRNKWGSISSQGNLSIADDVLSLPNTLIDYLIVHELAHLKFPNHGKGFQLLMDMTIPDWRRREKQLAAWIIES